MFLLQHPASSVIARFISSKHDLPFSYREVGATRSEAAPPGYNADHNSVKLGYGEDVYLRAVAALRNWKQFDLGWVMIVPPNTPIEVGRIVAIQARTFRFWSLSAARVVYVIEDEAH